MAKSPKCPQILADFIAAHKKAEGLRKQIFTAEIHGDFSDRDEDEFPEIDAEGIYIMHENGSEHEPITTVVSEDFDKLVEYCATFCDKDFYIYQNGKIIASGHSYPDSNGYDPNLEFH